MPQPNQSDRSFTHNGVIISIYFFCKAAGVPKPKVVHDPITFMNKVVQEKQLDLDELTAKITIYREHHKARRRLNNQRRSACFKHEEQEFFMAHGGAKTKDRNCLRCNSVFTSHHGNRTCERCNYIINHVIGDEGM